MGPNRLGFRGVVGRFYNRLEAVLATGWQSDIALSMPTDQKSEEYRWLGATPAMREWLGGRQSRSLRENGITITNKKFELTLSFDVDDLRRDKSPQSDIRISEMAERAAEHWHKLLTALLIANPTAYDAQTFFSATHAEGDSGTQLNLLTSTQVGALNVSTAAAPTVAEMEAIILGLVQYMLGYKDDQAEPMNAEARSFLIMVPTNMWVSLIKALNLPVIVDGSASRSNLLPMAGAIGGYTFRPVVNPRLTTTTEMYIFRTDASAKPLIMQEELFETSESDKDVFDNNLIHFGVKALRNVGTGYWQYAAKATLS